MDVAGFIASFRGVTGDDLPAYLWSDDLVLEYLNDALNEACERALLLEDAATADCCSIALTMGGVIYPLHASVLQVKRVSFRGQALTETSVEKMDFIDPMWESRTGQPCRYILTENALRLVPAPTDDLAGELLALTVYRRELVPRTLTGPAAAAPELPAHYHTRLLNWMFHRAYSRKDAETLDVNRAKDYDGLFERDFGARIDYNAQRKIRDRRPPVTRFRF